MKTFTVLVAFLALIVIVLCGCATTSQPTPQASPTPQTTNTSPKTSTEIWHTGDQPVVTIRDGNTVEDILLFVDGIGPRGVSIRNNAILVKGDQITFQYHGITYVFGVVEDFNDGNQTVTVMVYDPPLVLPTPASAK